MSLKKILSNLNPWSWLKFLSLRVRLTAIFVLIFGVTTILFSNWVYSLMIDSLQQDFDDALFNYSVDVSESIEIGAKGDLLFPPLKFDHGKILPFPLGTALIRVVHVSGTVLAQVGDYGKFSPPFKKDFEKLARGEEASYRTLDDMDVIPDAEANSYRMISFPIDSSNKPQLILQIAVPMILMDTQIKNRLRIVQIGLPLVLIIAALAGLFVASRALAPVKRMTEIAHSISALDLAQRVPVPKTKDELSILADTLNEMLSRLEKSFESQEKFIADASHQLLTPLTILKGEIELIQKDTQPEKIISNFFTSAEQEIDHLTKIVQDMLLLARIDAGTGILQISEVSLDEVLLEAMARIDKLAKNKSVQLKFNIVEQKERRMVLGDFDLLTNMSVNLIENAIKYSPRDSIVEIELDWLDENSRVRIQDNGPGISSEILPHIFNRFSRDPQMSLKVKGYGLGLAIAQKIAILHKSSILVVNSEKVGACFEVEIKNI